MSDTNNEIHKEVHHEEKDGAYTDVETETGTFDATGPESEKDTGEYTDKDE